jgi:1-acyl-sn-glycerol-3-phosphate acyltransferase
MTYWIFKSTVLVALRLCFRPKVEGMRNLPDGPAIIASNHLSFSDSFFLGAVVSRRLTFLAKSSYFTTPGLKGQLTARLFRGLGQLAVDRDGGSSTGTMLQAAVQVLRQGGLLGIYPEGTRSPDGRLYRGRMGVARIALAAGVPVVPVAMIGTERIRAARRHRAEDGPADHPDRRSARLLSLPGGGAQPRRAPLRHRRDHE